MLPVDQTADTVDLDLHPNEASDLAVVPDGMAGCGRIPRAPGSAWN